MQPGCPHRGAGAGSCPAARARLTAAAPSQPQAAGGAAAATKFPGGPSSAAPQATTTTPIPSPLCPRRRLPGGAASSGAARPPPLPGCGEDAPHQLRTSSSPVPRCLPFPSLLSRAGWRCPGFSPPLRFSPAALVPPPADPRRALTLFQLRRWALLSRGMGKETSLQLAAGVLSIFWRRLQLEQGAEGPGRSLPPLVSPCATVPLAINKRARSEMRLQRKKCKMLSLIHI